MGRPTSSVFQDLEALLYLFIYRLYIYIYRFSFGGARKIQPSKSLAFCCLSCFDAVPSHGCSH